MQVHSHLICSKTIGRTTLFSGCFDVVSATSVYPGPVQAIVCFEVDVAGIIRLVVKLGIIINCRLCRHDVISIISTIDSAQVQPAPIVPPGIGNSANYHLLARPGRVAPEALRVLITYNNWLALFGV